MELSAYLAQNPDFIAWLRIPGTNVDYPVVQTDDPDDYLTHTFSGKQSVVGTLFSLAAWMSLSWLYSYYADHFSHYSVLYGSIGAVIVVLIWLNLTAVTLILGAEVNGVLISMRKDEDAA